MFKRQVLRDAKSVNGCSKQKSSAGVAKRPRNEDRLNHHQAHYQNEHEKSLNKLYIVKIFIHY